MKNLKKLLLITTFSFLSLILVGCSFEKNKTFTVTFDSNGGTEVKKQEVKANEKVEEPNEPTKEGYSFKGWYLSGKKYDFDKKVTKDIKLKARWTKLDEIVETVIDTPVAITPIVNTTPVVNTPTIAKRSATLSIQSDATVYLNQVAKFVVSSVANDDVNKTVVGKATISDLEVLEKLEYLGEDEIWYEISIEDVYGEEGFALVDASCSFRAIFNKIGDYEITVQLLDATTNEVVATTTQIVSVLPVEPVDIIAEKDQVLTEIANTLNETASNYGFESISYNLETKTVTFVIDDLTKSLTDYQNSDILSLFMTHMEGATKVKYTIGDEEKEQELTELTEDELIDLVVSLFESLSENEELTLGSVANKSLNADITFTANDEEVTENYTVEFIYEDNNEEDNENNNEDSNEDNNENNNEDNNEEDNNENQDGNEDNTNENDNNQEAGSTIDLEKDVAISEIIVTLNETANDYGFESVTYNTTTNVMEFTIMDPEASLLDYSESGFIDLIKTSFTGADGATCVIGDYESYIDLVDVREHELISFALKAIRKLSDGNGYSLGAFANKSMVLNVEFIENNELVTIPYTISFVMNA